MSDQEVTYSTLQFLQSPSEAQGGLWPAATKRPRKAAEKKFSVCWHHTAVTLGLICLLLLIIIAVLVTNLFQCHQEKHPKQKILANLSQEYQNIQNENSLLKQRVMNLTLEYNLLRNKTHRPTLGPESHSKRTCQLCESPLACCERKCYYFLKGNKTWPECKESCQHRGFSLLKIDDEKELNLLRPRVRHRRYWIGLLFDGLQNKWKWIDSGTSGIDFKVERLPMLIGNCAFVTQMGLRCDDCFKTYNCICEKTTKDIFPASS